MTEHERVQAEYNAWRGGRIFADARDGFEAGWLAAKEDSHRTQLIAPEQKPLPTFDEWFQDKHCCGFDVSVYARKGLPYDSVMRLLSEHLRAYVSEMVRRR